MRLPRTTTPLPRASSLALALCALLPACGARPPGAGAQTTAGDTGASDTESTSASGTSGTGDTSGTNGASGAGESGTGGTQTSGTGDTGTGGNTGSTGGTSTGGCDPGTSDCAGTCVNLDADPQHCGACDNPCDPGQVCGGGQCAEPAVLELVAGGAFSCARFETGAVRCWGDNSRGQLGLGHTNAIGDDELPSASSDADLGAPAVQLAAGMYHVCAILDTGDVRCWGNGDSGILGIGSPFHVGDDELPSESPTVVGLDAPAVEIVSKQNHNCARLDTGAVRCWGANDGGKLGYGHTTTIGTDWAPIDGPLAGDVDIGSPTARVSTGASFTCALSTAGALRCWGSNLSGQLGIGSTMNVGASTLPSEGMDAALGGKVTALALGGDHACAILEDESVRCWGDGGQGSLGLGLGVLNVGNDELPTSVPPVSLTTLGAAPVAIQAGFAHTCVRFDDGGMQCWGYNAPGSLGLGNSTLYVGDDEVPSDVGRVVLSEEILAMALGAGHTCVLLAGNRIRCWGANDAGQLGYGHTQSLGDTPGEVPDLLPNVEVR